MRRSGLTAIAGVALSLPLSSLAHCIWTVNMFARKMGTLEVDWLKCYTCLFFRFQPTAYWYVVVIVVRSLLLTVLLVAPSIALQIVLMQTVVIASLIVTVRLIP
jgi:hypothetical protein